MYTLKGWILWYVNCVSVKKRTWQDCFTWTMLMTAVCFLRQLEPNSLLLCVIISLIILWLINPIWHVSGLFLSSSNLPENSEIKKNKEIDALKSIEWVQGIHIRLLWKWIKQSAWKWKDDCLKTKTLYGRVDQKKGNSQRREKLMHCWLAGTRLLQNPAKTRKHE